MMRTLGTVVMILCLNIREVFCIFRVKTLSDNGLLRRGYKSLSST